MAMAPTPGGSTPALPAHHRELRRRCHRGSRRAHVASELAQRRQLWRRCAHGACGARRRRGHLWRCISSTRHAGSREHRQAKLVCCAGHRVQRRQVQRRWHATQATAYFHNSCHCVTAVTRLQQVALMAGR
eukprot:364189-Chlamydomonas_euryale.AAC.29